MWKDAFKSQLLLNTFVGGSGAFLFSLTAAGSPTCNHCFGRDAASCSGKQGLQVCSLDPVFNSLGTTHCGSAVGKYQDRAGNVQDLFYRGCFNCAGKYLFGAKLL